MTAFDTWAKVTAQRPPTSSCGRAETNSIMQVLDSIFEERLHHASALTPSDHASTDIWAERMLARAEVVVHPQVLTPLVLRRRLIELATTAVCWVEQLDATYADLPGDGS
jgi:hypothetical protein